MDENTRNLILAAVLSFAVLIAWQAFYGVPKMKEEQARRQETEKTSQLPDGAVPAVPKLSDRPTPAEGAPARPGDVPQPVTSAGASKTHEAALAASPRVAIETPSLEGSIALKGARIDDLILSKYRETAEPGSANVVLFSPAGSENAYYAEHGWVAAAGTSVKLPAADTLWSAETRGSLTPSSPVRLVWDNGGGLVFRRTVSVDENYLFTVSQSVENKTRAAVVLYPYALVSRFGTPEVQSFYILHEGLVGFTGELQEIDYDDALEDKVLRYSNVTGGWLGITDKYWATAVIPDQTTPFQGRFKGTQSRFGENYQADYLSSPVTIAPGATATAQGLVFAGAKQVSLIDEYAERHGIEKFDLLIDWGWFYFLTKPLFFALDYIFKLVGNFGLAILIVTVAIKLVLFPLANKSYVSMSRMKKLQPEMQRIKERFENDRTRQQQAMMELYKTEKVNPASGCLPIVVQIPVFFALYKVLFVTIEMRHAPFYGWIKDLSAPDPTTLFNLFGLIPWDPPTFLMIGVWPLIMGATMFVQMRLNPAPPDPVQAKIFAWMPLFFMFLLAPFPAGLVIYWAWNNLLSVIQQSVIMHRQGVEITLWENLGIKKQAGQRSKT